MAFLSRIQLENMGFRTLGDNVLISERASIYNAAKIDIGSNVRIDDFCILSPGEGGIELGDYIHIACYVSLIGKATIRCEDFVGISSRTAVYSSSDDYGGSVLVGPTIPDAFKNVDHRPVVFKKYSLIGATCVILPGVIVGEGTAVGALSLVTKSLDAWGIYSGQPAKYLKPRKKDLIDLAERLLKNG